jgi:hypothetical protein
VRTDVRHCFRKLPFLPVSGVIRDRDDGWLHNRHVLRAVTAWAAE